MKFLSKTKASEFKNKICLLRLDFNTEDNWRMDASLPTIKFLISKAKSVVILSHKGRPKGFDSALSLKSTSNVLSRKLKKKVIFIPHFRFPEIEEFIRSSPKGSVFLLENLRFLDGEAENSDSLAKNLSRLGDVYINDAFAVSHRANASIVAITNYLPSYAGLGLEMEIKQLTHAMKSPKKPMVVILGGLKIEDKLRVVDNLKSKTAAFLVGGALTDGILKKLDGAKLVTPLYFERDRGIIRDIGPEAVKKFCEIIRLAKTVIWNGPLGDIRDKRFRNGTLQIAKCITRNEFTLVGGGETVMFLKKMKLDKKMGFISTGGGAMLDFLAGRKLPGIEALK